ncbi:MAG: hypothetical protein KBH11_12615 [Bacteroidia bacterium]|nr:hypothetical protein [Bacteroidia bacterium]
MKVIGLLFLLAISLTAFGQSENQSQSIRTVDRIFAGYIKQNESTDSEVNRIEMELALKSLQAECDIKYFSRLIDVWMYYDPTDFPTRRLVMPILLRDKPEALKAIEKRIKKKKKWETNDTAPFSELISLREKFK